eukprot:m.104688 g.104688  ORF g.104688 m.104688 type:complete len:373 (-) comp51609_c0_seq2:137-1255(-)
MNNRTKLSLSQLWRSGSAECQKTLETHQSAVACLEVNLVDNVAAVGSFDHSVSIWSLPSLEMRRKITFPSQVCSLAFLPILGELAVGTYANGVHMIDFTAGITLKKIEDVSGGVWGLAATRRTPFISSSYLSMLAPLSSMISAQSSAHLLPCLPATDEAPAQARPLGTGFTAQIIAYDGSSENGKRHGQGTCRWSNGLIYTGEWRLNARFGTGSLLCANGDQYVGQWLDDVMHGSGVLTWSDGSTYTGSFEVGKKCGRGTYKSSNGNTYEGEFADDKRHGKGILSYANGDWFETVFKEDLVHGKVIYHFAEGDMLVGDVESGRPVGLALYRLSEEQSAPVAWDSGPGSTIKQYAVLARQCALRLLAAGSAGS